LDRFGITYSLGYLSESVETDLLCGIHKSLEKDVVNKVVQFAGLIRRAFSTDEISVTLSNRGLRSICSILEKDYSLLGAIELVYLNKLSDEAELQASVEFVKTITRRM
jgi:hypothetical protein